MGIDFENFISFAQSKRLEVFSLDLKRIPLLDLIFGRNSNIKCNITFKFTHLFSSETFGDYEYNFYPSGNIIKEDSR